MTASSLPHLARFLGQKVPHHLQRARRKFCPGAGSRGHPQPPGAGSDHRRLPRLFDRGKSSSLKIDKGTHTSIAADKGAWVSRDTLSNPLARVILPMEFLFHPDNKVARGGSLWSLGWEKTHRPEKTFLDNRSAVGSGGNGDDIGSCSYGNRPGRPSITLTHRPSSSPLRRIRPPSRL